MPQVCELDFSAPRSIGGSEIHERETIFWQGDRVGEPVVHRLQLMLRGGLAVRTKLGCVELRRGSVFLFLRGEAYACESRTPKVRTLSLYFDPQPADALVPHRRGLSRSSLNLLRVPALLPAEHARGVRQGLFELHQLTLERSSTEVPDEQRRLGWRMEAKTRLLFLSLSEWLDPRKVRTEVLPLHIRRIVQMARRRPRAFKTMEEAAAIAGVPASTLRRHFKEATGRSLKQFHLEVRVDHAQELLAANPDLSLSAIAERVGFSDEYHLSKVFKKKLGVSPSDYRRRWLVSG